MRLASFERRCFGRTYGRTYGRTDLRTDGRTYGRTDKPSYRDARTHLKNDSLTHLSMKKANRELISCKQGPIHGRQMRPSAYLYSPRPSSHLLRHSPPCPHHPFLSLAFAIPNHWQSRKSKRRVFAYSKKKGYGCMDGRMDGRTDGQTLL